MTSDNGPIATPGTDQGSKPSWDFWERHHEDEYVDHVEIACVPRYKTSGLSGDEWRFSYVVRISRKGTVLREYSHHTLKDAAAHLPWILLTWAEDSEGGNAINARQALDHSQCFNPGCAEPATVVYRMKKEGPAGYEKPVAEYRRALRGFCARHSTRGDCGLVDADANYEFVRGHQEQPRAEDESPSGFAGVVDFNVDPPVTP